jgi:hypothetical protein
MGDLVPIALVGYAPDLDPATPGVFSYCKGVEPTRRGWKVQRRQLATHATSGAAFATNSYILDGLVSELVDGTEVAHFAVYDAAADKVKLYAITGSNSLGDKSRAAFYTKPNGTTTNNVSFCQYGNLTLATNLTDVVQVRDASGSGVFADSAATAIPKAKLCVTWGPPTSPRVILFHYNDGTNYPDGWWTSHQGGPAAAWTVDPATGAMSGRLIGVGPIRCAIAYGDNVVAFGDRQMWFGQFIGPPFVIGWSKVANDIGCCGPYAAKVINGVLYWVGLQGLFAWTGQGEPQRIEIPIQRTIAMQVFAVGEPASRNIQLTGDATTRRLFVAIKTGPLTSSAVIAAFYSISLDSLRVGLPTGTRDSTVVLSQIYDRLRAAYITVGAEVTLTQESGPYAAVVGEAIGFGLPFIGADKGESKIQTLIPRFVTAPISYRMTGYFGPTFSEATSTAPPVDVVATPWRADILKAANWHAPRFYFVIDASHDMEVIDVVAETVEAGRR